MARNSNVLVGSYFVDAGGQRTAESVEKGLGGEDWSALSELERSVLRQRLNRIHALIVADAQTRGSGVLSAPEPPEDADEALEEGLEEYAQIANLALQILAERIADDPARVVEDRGTREATYDDHDPGWVTGVPLAWLQGRVTRHDWLPAQAVPTPIPNDARLVLLGDWGSGLYGAPVMAAAIGADPRPIDALVHLGDVYYAGTERAVRDRFLAFWPERPEAVSRACNSNHEMYPGGFAYFDLTLKQFQQPSSAFALQNDHWLIVGLDTAYREGRLENGQAEWLVDLVARAGDRKVMLLSHHQGFSLYDKAAKHLTDALRPLLDAGKIHFWYWGHEHRCVIFDQHPEWKLWGRCIGHSGFPEFRRRDYQGDGAELPTAKADQRWLSVPPGRSGPRGLVLDGPNPYVAQNPERYVPHGYATIELSGDALVERIHDADGTVLAVVQRTAEGVSRPVVP